MTEALLWVALVVNWICIAFHLHMARSYREGLRTLRLMGRMYEAGVDMRKVSGLCGICGDPVQVVTFPRHAAVVHPEIEFPYGWPEGVPMVVAQL